MSEPVLLTASQSPVPRMSVGPTRATQPHLAVVYATATGEVVCFEGRPLRPGQQVFSRYRTRYEVDMRGHRGTALLGRDPLVSRDGVHTFEVQVSFGFRIEGWQGAENWVRSGVRDALPVVHGYLVARFHGAGRQFAVEDASGLERHLNQLCASAVTLPEGLTVHGCRVSVRPDAKSLAHLGSLIDSGRREEQGAAAHSPDRGAVVRQAELDALRQKFEIDAAARQADALAHTLADGEGLIRHYLITHPDDAAGAFAMFRQLEEARASTAELQNQRALGLFQVMAEKGLVQAGDLEQMRSQLTGTVGRATGGHASQQFAGPAQLTSARPWDSAPPHLAAGAPAAAPPDPSPAYAPPYGAAPGSPQPYADPYPPERQQSWPRPPAGADGGDAGRTASPAPVDRAAPVYLVLDESLDRGTLDELNRGLSSLHSALSGAPEVSATLRVCVLGMAATTESRLDLDTVGPGTRSPILTGRPGLSYTHAFRTVGSLIGQDIVVVKAEGVQVLRPLVYFVTGGGPDDGASWASAHRDLTDPAGNPVAPHVIALGLGADGAHGVRAVATRPEFGFVAAPHQDAASAAHNCAAFLRDSVVGYGQRLASGDPRPQFSLSAPDGFLPAQDAL
ncbi:hypothetical protein [Streptomyces sp. NPDC008150]|uniref:vWA domain-containing protein n=1 Tax=Streptomyces sp. NPDC008150 TaxID=3364816 RepID=UPI0036E9544E